MQPDDLPLAIGVHRHSDYCTKSSRRRVETPPIHASWITPIGGLPRHLPRLQERRQAVALYEGEQVTNQIYVAGGFAEVTPERVQAARALIEAVDGLLTGR